jgi:hypothetical protein
MAIDNFHADPRRGFTPREVAKLLRVSPDRIRSWIISGQLGAINTAPSRCGKPRFVVLSQHLDDFQRRRRVGPPPKPLRKRRRQPGAVDFYPDGEGEAVPP